MNSESPIQPAASAATIVSVSKLQASVLLGVAGLLPFFTTLAAALAGRQVFGFDAEFLFLSYSVMILSFLCGALWGLSLASPDAPASGLVLLVSNLFAVAVWFAMLLGMIAVEPALAILALGYVLVFISELKLLSAVYEQLPEGYRSLRAGLTGAVVAAHLPFIIL